LAEIGYDRLKENFPFLDGLGGQDQLRLEQMMQLQNYPAGRVLIGEGSVCQALSFVLSGTIRVFKLSPEGREVTLYRVEQGDTCLLSVSCLVSDRAFPAAAEVEADAELAMLPADRFRLLLHSHAPLQQYLLQNLLARFGQVMEVLDTVAFTGRRQALASILMRRHQQGRSRNITITHQALAAELGTAREVVSRFLKQWERQQLVSLSRGRIRLLDLDRLERLTGM